MDQFKHRPFAHLLPTLFDRLCDDAPTQQSESPETYAVSRQKMLAIIQRDLSYLLNTVNITGLFEEAQYKETQRSTLNYGIAPLAGSYLSTHKWPHVEKNIRRAIVDFEPRLIPEALRIVPLVSSDSEHHYNILVFEIHGLIHMDPYPMEFLMQSAIDLENNRLSVST